MYRINNVATLLSQVRTIGQANFRNAFQAAMEASRMNGMVNFRQIGQDDTDYEYTPNMRSFTMGDTNPASCKSTPTYVDDAGSEPVWGRTEEHEAAYEICIKDCKAENPRELILAKERQVADVLVGFLWRKMWFGSPARMQYGLLNHQLITPVESPANGTGGSTLWKNKTNSQIMQEIRKVIKYMVAPRILIGESVYDGSLGVANTASGSDSGCALRVDCIMRLLRDQPDVNIGDQSMQFMEELDKLEMYANAGVALIYDAGSLVMTASSPIYTAPTSIGSKRVEAIRSVNTGGIQVDYTDSVFILTGI